MGAIRRLLILGLLAVSHTARAGDEPAPDAAAFEFFEKQVRPLLVERCQKCHGPVEQKGGLRLDSREGALEGGDTGPAVVPGQAGESRLVEAIHYGDVLRMPPKSKLSEAEIATLTRWVEQGAAWPGGAPKAANAPARGGFDLAARAEHWSFRPLRAVPVPDVADARWPETTIDRFLLARLEAAGLRPAPDADRLTVLRRLTFDVAGLPPTPAEIEAFQADGRPDAYERQVERLLASPRYGERWGRHWLDLVRYAETSGHEFDYDIPGAWRYRDYVVRAFNADVPFDRFLVEHLAGDLVPSPRLDPATGRNESILGTASLFLGEGTHSPVDVREEQARRIDNQIDVLGKTFLGLTLACARCHDHKFDPISQRDYYALAGFFKSTRHQQAFLDPPEPIAPALAVLDSLRERIARLLEIPGAVHEADEGETIAGEPPFEGFDGESYGPWTASGPAYGTGPTRGPTLRLSTAEAAPRAEIVPAGWAHSGITSDRLQGVLRSPSFTISAPYLHVRAMGRGGRINVVVDGFEKIRAPIYGGLSAGVDTREGPKWFTIDLTLWAGHRAYIELADGAVADFTEAQSRVLPGDGFLAVDEVRFSDGPGAPSGDGEAPEALTLDPDGDAIGSLLARYRAVETALPAPTLASCALDGPGEDEAFLPRGNHRTPGDAVPRRLLEVLDGQVAVRPDDGGSGRLALAEALADPGLNPLTARVVVNRLWQHHFGRGPVPTPDDFGHMGQPPSHPELLDALAMELIGSGWSLKAVHRQILMSHAYRMSSRPVPAAEGVDPDNRLLHRANVRRLEAEAIRDAMLAISGRLDSRLYGPGVAPALTPYMDGRGRPKESGPVDGNGRRSVYLAVRRNFLSPFLLAFDFPAPASTMGRRHATNVPAQALSLMNDPFVLDQALRWAEGLESVVGPDPGRRIEQMFLQACGRPPAAAERREALAFVEASDPGAVAAWAELAHVLFNTKAFLYVD